MRGDPTRSLAATVLIFEAMVVVFAALVARSLSSLGTRDALLGGLALAVALAVTSGLLRRRGGYVVGTVLQAVVLATGAVVPAMYVIGGIFAMLWVGALVIGRRIRAARRAHEAPTGG